MTEATRSEDKAGVTVTQDFGVENCVIEEIGGL